MCLGDWAGHGGPGSQGNLGKSRQVGGTRQSRSPMHSCQLKARGLHSAILFPKAN